MSLRLQPTRRCLFSLALPALALPAPAQDIHQSAQQISAALKQAAFDPAQCWRIRELHLVRNDIKLYLSDGYLIFSKAVAGKPVSALFSAEVEGGDAEVLLLPPTPGERQSLSRFIQSPNLNEHFRTALFIFTDATAQELQSWLAEHESKPAPEMGALLTSQYSATLANLLASFEVRLVQDLTGEVKPEHGLFFAALAGSNHGNFDVVHDPQGLDQIVVGQIQTRQNLTFYDIWTSFPSRPVRQHTIPPPARQEFRIEAVNINAAIGADLHLSATTTLRIRIPDGPYIRSRRNTLAFEISRRVRVREVRIDGQTTTVMQRENLRSNLLRGSDNEVFLVAVETSLAPGEHTVELQHDGDVIVPAGNGVFFVGARGTWYPHHGLQFAPYDITFRFPKNLTLVATGDLLEEKLEGETKLIRRRSQTPLRIAGFNLGEYKRSEATRGGVTVEIYANKAIEAALAPRRAEVAVTQPIAPNMRGSRRPGLENITILPPPPDPAGSIHSLAAEVADVFDFLTTRLGPSPLKTLAVSPIPGTFGQGFPGLIYLSTLSYLPPRDRPQFANQGMQQIFFSDILVPHEVAHQWWGNTVSTIGYRDEWMMEALANYSALLLYERKKGPKALDDVLLKFRDHLIEKNKDGVAVDETGPIRFGSRLDTSTSPEAYRMLIYEKGAWILHMIRRRVGEANFFPMLREFYVKFSRTQATTDDLRFVAARFLPKDSPDPQLEQLFTTYVEGTGIPILKLRSRVSRTAKGAVVNIDLDQTGVPDTFSIDVPVEIDFGRGKTEIRWIRTDGEKNNEEWSFTALPLKISLDPHNALLAVRQ